MTKTKQKYIFSVHCKNTSHYHSVCGIFLWGSKNQGKKEFIFWSASDQWILHSFQSTLPLSLEQWFSSKDTVTQKNELCPHQLQGKKEGKCQKEKERTRTERRKKKNCCKEPRRSESLRIWLTNARTCRLGRHGKNVGKIKDNFSVWRKTVSKTFRNLFIYYLVHL